MILLWIVYDVQHVLSVSHVAYLLLWQVLLRMRRTNQEAANAMGVSCHLKEK